MQAYKYQQFEYREIFRRFCRANSRDPDVREFRVQCLKEIPEKIIILWLMKTKHRLN
jgi:hypothetical protein